MQTQTENITGDNLPQHSDNAVVVTTFYRFVDLPDYEQVREDLLKFCNEHELKGTILLAREGINSTTSGSRAGINALYDYFNADPRFKDMTYKESYVYGEKPFQKMKVRLKKEIVALKVDGLDPTKDAGTYVKSDEWDDLIRDPDVVVVDTRNFYEYAVGTFENAINPNTQYFREFPQWVEENLDPEKNKKVAMFCTGGIRCEKSTALLNHMGFENVYHLDGGILQYLEDKQGKDHAWQGDCFVFDERSCVNGELEPVAIKCASCGAEMTTEEMKYHPYNPEVDPDDLLCRNCRKTED